MKLLVFLGCIVQLIDIQFNRHLKVGNNRCQSLPIWPLSVISSITCSSLMEKSRRQYQCIRKNATACDMVTGSCLFREYHIPRWHIPSRERQIGVDALQTFDLLPVLPTLNCRRRATFVGEEFCSRVSSKASQRFQGLQSNFKSLRKSFPKAWGKFPAIQSIRKTLQQYRFMMGPTLQ